MDELLNRCRWQVPVRWLDQGTNYWLSALWLGGSPAVLRCCDILVTDQEGGM